VAFALATRRLYLQRYQLLGWVVLDVRARREMDTDELQVVRRAAGRHGVRRPNLRSPGTAPIGRSTASVFDP